ncbi:MAG TPA: glycosyltransferase family 2 protein [Gemmataceae bacterium]|jgi:cellulose synthase/poly-beta-1,6-N-acetylglucosamine synthase-like glycosyltransferase|nr:glycosyltransferase family 2 protein [Gemmataceae bacterium]
MDFLEICFWMSAALVIYTYLGYPIILSTLARTRRRGVVHTKTSLPSVSVVLAAYNERSVIGRRLEELTKLVSLTGVKGEVILVSDGSTDGTAEVARQRAPGSVVVLDLPRNRGKAAALSAGCAAAQNEIIVFADARQSWAPGALRLLLENFSDPAVGAVSGDLVIESSPGVLAGVGLYWRYEKWLRKQESRVHSTIGVTGAISAVRRELFQPVPEGTILDDVYWPLTVAMRGFRVLHDERARAHDRLPDRTSDEFRRKLRTLSGNFQLLMRLPAALLPWRNPVWLQFVSHKLLRLLVPWMLPAMLASSVLLEGTAYRLAFWMQASFYLIGIAGIWAGARLPFRLVSATASFLVLNAAAWLAFWVWASGSAARSWRKAIYEAPIWPLEPVHQASRLAMLPRGERGNPEEHPHPALSA